MKAAIVFWVACHTDDILTAFVVALVIIIGAVLIDGPRLIRQAQCKHDGPIHMTKACDMVCLECGENLEFGSTHVDEERTNEGRTT